MEQLKIVMSLEQLFKIPLKILQLLDMDILHQKELNSLLLVN